MLFISKNIAILEVLEIIPIDPIQGEDVDGDSGDGSSDDEGDDDTTRRIRALKVNPQSNEPNC